MRACRPPSLRRLRRLDRRRVRRHPLRRCIRVRARDPFGGQALARAIPMRVLVGLGCGAAGLLGRVELHDGVDARVDHLELGALRLERLEERRDDRRRHRRRRRFADQLLDVAALLLECHSKREVILRGRHEADASALVLLRLRGFARGRTADARDGARGHHRTLLALLLRGLLQPLLLFALCAFCCQPNRQPAWCRLRGGRRARGRRGLRLVALRRRRDESAEPLHEHSAHLAECARLHLIWSVWTWARRPHSAHCLVLHWRSQGGRAAPRAPLLHRSIRTRTRRRGLAHANPAATGNRPRHEPVANKTTDRR